MPRKVFTAGEVLAAADVNEFLMDQAVQSFAGTAARGSAIPTPVEGMVTYLEDIDDIRTYDGSAWVSPFGMTLIESRTFTGATNVTFDNVFNSLYESYKIIINATSCGGGHDAAFTLRVGGVLSQTNYNDAYMQVFSSAVSGVNGADRNSARLGRFDEVGGFLVADIVNPAVASNTYATVNSIDSSGFLRTSGFRHTLSTAYDGFNITFNDTTGKIRVYGMRK
jgi:hypothetical protein